MPGLRCLQILLKGAYPKVVMASTWILHLKTAGLCWYLLSLLRLLSLVESTTPCSYPSNNGEPYGFGSVLSCECFPVASRLLRVSAPQYVLSMLRSMFINRWGTTIRLQCHRSTFEGFFCTICAFAHTRIYCLSFRSSELLFL